MDFRSTPEAPQIQVDEFVQDFTIAAGENVNIKIMEVLGIDKLKGTFSFQLQSSSKGPISDTDTDLEDKGVEIRFNSSNNVDFTTLEPSKIVTLTNGTASSIYIKNLGTDTSEESKPALVIFNAMVTYII